MVEHAIPLPTLIAHRGYAARYPENTLPALEAALRAGARYVEIDIQLSADHQPFLFHDETLLRTTGQPGLITELDSHAIARLDAREPARLGDRFRDIAVPSLADFVTLMNQWPQCRALVEIKEESLQRFGIELTTDTVLQQLASLGDQAIVISYDEACLRHARQRTGCAIGWVLRNYDQHHRNAAERLQPEWLICNHAKTGTGQLWPGRWHWALYEVIDPILALQLAKRGATLIETMAIGELLPRLASDGGR
ncbi:MAG: glycerophosphodiester phosphodiesterase [Gammaproteobacteria bacterium]|nr:glycerophosphodiester phosphodiesterase [Gammaproteobacteria bacterium]